MKKSEDTNLLGSEGRESYDRRNDSSNKVKSKLYRLESTHNLNLSIILASFDALLIYLNNTHRGTNYMSTSAFQTMTEEIMRQKAARDTMKKSRSQDDAGMKSSGSVKSIEDLIRESRQALYGTLPLIATFGMQHRENQIKRILSRVRRLKFIYELRSLTNVFFWVCTFQVSISSLENLPQHNENAVLLSEVDVDEIIMTFPMMMAVLVAMVSQFLVGYNTGVMNPSQGHS